MATPSLAMIPSAYADSKVYSVLPNNGDGDFTFNRDSSATRVGQNGLIQTSSYYSSEKVTNGDFATDSDWSYQTGWEISGGSANFTATGSFAYLLQNVGFVTGKTYKVTFEVKNYVSGGVKENISGVEHTANGVYTHYIVATGAILYFYANTTFTGSIDNVSVKEVLGDQPRLDYTDGSCPSLLLEPASTNLVTYSEDFSNAYWVKKTTTVVSGQTFPSADSPTGAYKLVEGSLDGLQWLESSQGTSVAGDLTFSLYVKPEEVTKIGIRDGLSGGYGTFDLSSGAVIDNSVGADCSIELLSNGFYRIRLTMTGTTNFYFAVYLLSTTYTSGSPSGHTYLGNGTNGVYIFGAQSEQLSYATSYIPTSGQSAGVTRAAESCNSAGDAATFNSTEGVLYAEIIPQVSTGNFNISITADTQNLAQIQLYNGTLRCNHFGNNLGGAIANISFVVGALYKIALMWDNTSGVVYINGVKYTSTITQAVTNFDDISFDANGTMPFYGKTKDIRVYKTALTDAELTELTT